MVETENKSEHNFPLVEHTSPFCNTSDKLSSMLNNRTICDIRQLPDPYKLSTSVSIITTLTHLIHCHDRPQKLLRTMDFDLQPITQSAQVLQSALDSVNTLFNSTNLH